VPAAKKGSSSKKSSSKRSSSGSDAKSKRTVHNKMEKVMHEYKHGELKSGGRKKVKNPKQAIAIGLSEARRSGAHIPANPNEKKRASKKTASKKSSAKKSTSKKSSSKKSTSKKSSGSKRTTSKKTASKKR